MKIPFKSVRNGLGRFGIAVIRQETLKQLVCAQRETSRSHKFHRFCLKLTPEALRQSLLMYPQTKSENFQDIFAMLVLGKTRNGFFVEFGATDGIEGSNTYYMEKTLGWPGILAEPARCWHERLNESRTAYISHKCVWDQDQVKIPFLEAEDAGFSTLEMLSKSDKHKYRRKPAHIYEVETITLTQLLKTYNAPNTIDYLSIDTEGSELNILRSHDFSQYRPLVVCVEHNYRAERQSIVDFMKSHNYVQAPPSVTAFDDYFVCRSLEGRLKEIFVENIEANDYGLAIV